MTPITLNSSATRAAKKFNKEKIKKELTLLTYRIGELQNLLYAESKHALLIVFQGMDASGKDGAVKNVFNGVTPLGCRVFSFKQPTEIEMKHDFLWRVHHRVPEKGMIHIFNRSHYEDVVIQKVHHWVDEKVIQQRYDHINDFEKLLVNTGTVVLKFFLNVSKDEQIIRLQERLNDPTKKWKHSDNDLKERAFWNDYMKAYENAFKHCSKVTPWHIVPADQNWYKEYVIAKKVVETLEGLKMKYPELK